MVLLNKRVDFIVTSYLETNSAMMIRKRMGAAEEGSRSLNLHYLNKKPEISE